MAVGGIIRESKKVTSDYTIVEQDEIIYVDTSGGAITLTLAQPTNDNIVHIKVIDASNPVTINPENNKTIDGETSYNLTGGSITLAYFIEGSENEFKKISESKGYKVYTALLTQSGTNDPVATVLQNELSGAINWTRSATSGKYNGELTGAFTTNKTAFFVGNTWGLDFSITYIYRTDNNFLRIETNNLLTGAYEDGQLYETTIEIRVYN